MQLPNLSSDKSIIPIIDKLLFIIAVIVLILFSPYFIWRNQLFIFRFSYFIGIIMMLYIIFKHHNSDLYNFKLVLLFFIVSLYTMVGVLRYNAISYIPLLPLLFIALKPEEQLRVFDHFVTIIAIIYSIGIVSYLLGVLSMNFQISTTIAPNIGRNPYLVFFGHIEESGVSFWRFSSIFDEAGLIGTMNGVILTAIGVSKRDIRSLIILIAGLISFSLAFYIILFINLLFHLNIKKSFLVVLILVIVISISGNIFKELIATRMVFENGRLSGDNRTTQEFDSYFNLFVERGGNDLIFGIGPDYDQTLDKDITTGISSYKTLIISYGIFGLGLMICFYLFSVYEINNSLYGWLLALIFILIAYQRPFMLRYYNIVLFIGGLRYLKKYYLNAE